MSSAPSRPAAEVQHSHAGDQHGHAHHHRGHDHGHGTEPLQRTPSVRAHRPPFSLIRLSVIARLGLAALLAVALWAIVLLALA